MNESVNLRPAQQKILEYENGRLAISAVPGSGKTFTLTQLAVKLIASGQVDASQGQQILIVTYLNASVDTFKSRIANQLEASDMPPTGYDVRTLHSLALEIVRLSSSGLGEQVSDPIVIDETLANNFISQAVNGMIDELPDLWYAFLPDNSPPMQARWRDLIERTAKTFIRHAKNGRYPPTQIHAQLQQLTIDNRQLTVDNFLGDEEVETGGSTRYAQDDDSPHLSRPYSDYGDATDNSSQLPPLLLMLANIYGRYQTILHNQAALDFDDLIWQAVELLQQRPDFAAQLRQRWPFVLEDEAQDSVPLQEELLTALTGDGGNWVRVGDPNQAITSTFTAAHPRFFNAFIDRPDVTALPLPNSGRSAPKIIAAANAILNWVIDSHPVPEVRENTFRRQDILPTPAGDAQPNPPDSEASIKIRVFKHREDEELPQIAETAVRQAKAQPDQTIAILVPTNQIGYTVADVLDDLDASYDNLLRGGSREREIAAAMQAILAVLADPLNKKAVLNAHASLHALEHPAAQMPEESLERFHAVLRSLHTPEMLLFPHEPDDVLAALPTAVLADDEKQKLAQFAAFLQKMFDLRPLPIDDLALALGDELFASGASVQESDLVIAYQIATILRRWREMHPEWRLPELVAELHEAAIGRRRLPLSRATDFGFEPTAGRITLATQHGAKGLEWDTVYLVGIDAFWIPNSLDAYFLGTDAHFGGDPTAEAVAQLNYLMQGDAGIYAERSATESAHIDIISERLRLLYVGLTRARRHLVLTRSRATRSFNRERDAEPATVMGVLYRHLKN